MFDIAVTTEYPLLYPIYELHPNNIIIFVGGTLSDLSLVSMCSFLSYVSFLHLVPSAYLPSVHLPAFHLRTNLIARLFGLEIPGNQQKGNTA